MNSKNNKPSLSTPHAGTDYVALTDICQPKQWKTIPMAELKATGYPVYGANGIIGYSDEYNHENKTILIACRGASCGAINVCLPKSYVTGNAMCLDGLSEEFDLYFLQHYLQAYDFKQVISGSAQPQITRSGLNSVMVPILPTSSQRRISRILNVVDENRKQAEHAVNYLDTLIKSRFVDMFNEVKQTSILEELIDPETRISYGIVQPGPEGTGDMGVLRPVDIADGRLCLDAVKKIDRAIGNSYRRTELMGDEILTIVRGATGQTVRSKVDCAGMNVTRGIAVIRYEPSLINPDYLVGYMNSDNGKRYIADHTQGATLQQINIADLRVMPIPVPPLALQQEFADFVAQVDKLRFGAARQCTSCARL